MAGIYEIRRSNTLKILNELKTSYAIERKDFAELAGLPYNLLNQYLSDKRLKNIGDKSASKIAMAIGVDAHWIDQIRNEFDIKYTISKKYNTTNNDAPFEELSVSSPISTYKVDVSSFKLLPIMNTIYLIRGKAVEIIENNSVKYSVQIPSGMVDPIVFEISGSGFKRPYSNGFLILADAGVEPILSEDVLVKTIDNKHVIGEFAYDRNEEIEIRTIEEIPEIIQKSDIAKTYAIIGYLTARSKLPSSP